MCKYCRRLEQLRKEDRKLYDDVICHYKRVLKKDDKLFRRCLKFVCDVYVNCYLPEFLDDEADELCFILEDLLEGGVKQ